MIPLSRNEIAGILRRFDVLSFQDFSVIDSYHGQEDIRHKEMIAYKLYAKIAMLSAYWNPCAFSEYLKNKKYREKITALL